MAGNKMCQKCGKLLDENRFYTYKSGEKTELCKNCLTMHIDNFDPNTFLWLLEKMDVPYIPEEWNVLRDRAFEKNPNLNGMSVFGKYLSKMKLRQWKDYGWADSKSLVAQREIKTEKEVKEREEYETELKEQMLSGEISESEYKTLVSVDTQNKEYIARSMDIPKSDPFPQDKYYSENSAIVEDQLQKAATSLTAEDKLAMAIKWGTLYTPAEWIDLERDYQNMMNSFDIQDADTKNSLILICKTNLKMNQALDANDMEGFQKLSKVSESLRKSAKFTAAQKKDKEEVNFDSVGALVTFCEKEGGAIPRYKIAVDLDKADSAIAHMKDYLKTLIYNDTNLAQQIETYLKQLTLNEKRKQDREEAKKQGLDAVPLEDKDFKDYADQKEAQKAQDQALLKGESD